MLVRRSEGTDMAEIRFWAERRVGELVAAQRGAGLLAGGGDAARPLVGSGLSADGRKRFGLS